MQLRSNKRRDWVALALFRRDFTDNELLLPGFGYQLLRLRVVADQDFRFLQILIKAAGLDRLLANFQQPRVERRRLLAGEIRPDRPILSLDERFDLSLALNHHAERHRLHPTGAQTPADGLAKQRRNLVTHESIKHAPRLLRVNQISVDLFRMLKGCLHCAFGNFIEHHAKGWYGWFLGNDLLGQVLADRFAFAIRVSGKIDRVGGLRSLLQIRNDLLVVTLLGVGNDFVMRLEIILDVDAQVFRRQILDMPDRGHHDEVLAEIFIDRFRLGGRFDYD